MTLMKTNVTIPSREVPVLTEADVVVAGAGVGGACAAIAAARNGARTVLIERNAFPGGVATAGMMVSATNYLITRSGELITEGLPKELLDALVERGGAMPDYARLGQPQIPNDPETFKRLLISKLKEAGVTSLYGSLVTQTVVTNGRIEAVVCEAKGGAFAVEANNYVDATGDLDLFVLSGGPYRTREGLSTLLFRMANVDIDAIIDWYEAHPQSYSETADIPTSLEDTIRNWREYGVFHLPHYAGRKIAIVQQALDRGEFSDSYGKHVVELSAMGMFACRINHGMVLINSCAFKGNEFDIVRKSECEEEGRLVAKYLSDFLIRSFPGFEEAYIVDSAAEIGVRYSHWLDGKCTFTSDEYGSGKRFDDAIGRAAGIDRSPPPGRYRQAGEIPFGCLISDTPKNAVCGSGKSASTDPCGLLRGQVTCMIIGEAAGTACALASLENVPVNTVDVRKLQKQLRTQGVSLG